MADRLVIVDYGMGNLRSVQKAFERLGTMAHITADPQRIVAAAGVVLPGVGAFQDAMTNLRQRGLVEPLRERLAADRPFLGICLGLQLMFTTSYEDGTHEGLGCLPGEVIRFPSHAGVKVPHMGWNTVRPVSLNGAFTFLPHPAWVYFVHSYYVVPRESDLVALTCDYAGISFAAGLARGRFLATQFHPEKSQKVGLSILHSFLTLC